MPCHTRRHFVTHRLYLYHNCGQRMMCLDTFLHNGKVVSDWWCNKCCTSETVVGDEQLPKPHLKP